MCGIIAVLRQRDQRPTPDLAEALDAASVARAALDASWSLEERLAAAGHALGAVMTVLDGPAGTRAVLANRAQSDELALRLDDLWIRLDAIEHDLDSSPELVPNHELEATNAALSVARDHAWSARRDRLGGALATGDLAGSGAGDAAIEAFDSVRVALSAIDRLEVRGRDSAGLHVMVTNHALQLDDPVVARQLEARTGDPLFAGGAVRVFGDSLGFVYKAAAEIGELGDNTAHLRAALRADTLLHMALSAPNARVAVLGHTRWASVGIISEANAHPLDDREAAPSGQPFVVAALNGDIDNHADLEALDGLEIAPEITTDAKVIPALVARRRRNGLDRDEAFRATVNRFEGSVAIGAQFADAPDQLYLAVRGSGQGCYVGFADGAFIVASEPYGLVERASQYVRLDGETPARVEDPVGSQGQIVVLDAARAGTMDGVRRFSYDGTPLPVTAVDVAHAEITTRDVDRGDFPHYLLKEITESPRSFRKTLRGKIVESSAGLRVALGPDVLPDALRARLADRRIRRIAVIGQGTAAVAGLSLAAALGDLVRAHDLQVDARPATELSGFELDDDMGHVLVVAISQSGTTTDTNRTVDLARARGAAVVAIVNRRNSDLVDKADGVLYTSDGRDVEMSVASTKAFYAQVAAGLLLAHAIADAAQVPVDAGNRTALLAALRELPPLMERVIGRRREIAEVAQRYAPMRRYWALVGNGRNQIAARELRIKLSELCYKSIACDVTEDKKHIDLSAEPMILVCAAGLHGSTADDVGKELAIYRAHKAAPIAIVSEGEERWSVALDTIEVPATHPDLAFVLAALAGHLFGYEAALAIDASARPLREARASIEALASGGALEGRQALTAFAHAIAPHAERFLDGLAAGEYDGSLEARTAVRLSTLLRYATGLVPLDSYQAETGRVGTPSTLVLDLTDALTRAIEELTRPVDAIKHQAKTVTVGISRTDETLLRAPLVRAVLDAGAARDALSYGSLRTLVDLDEAVATVTGWTRYRIEGNLALEDHASIHVVDRGGIAAEIPSRTDHDPRLTGTKHRAAFEREVTVARGRRDGRTVVLVPEVKGNQVEGLTLLHVHLHEHLAAEAAARVLRGYRGRYLALRDAVTETESSFDDARLGQVPLAELLTEPVYVLAERWHTPTS
ncbi:MAG: SIS domain-containing protein [Acidimicrobiia bacterium]